MSTWEKYKKYISVPYYFGQLGPFYTRLKVSLDFRVPFYETIWSLENNLFSRFLLLIFSKIFLASFVCLITKPSWITMINSWLIKKIYLGKLRSYANIWFGEWRKLWLVPSITLNCQMYRCKKCRLVNSLRGLCSRFVPHDNFPI